MNFLPRRHDRALFIPLVIAINIFVFIMWHLPQYLPEKFMALHFLVSYEALQEGRWWVLLTSVFSHNMFFHIFVNMFVLRSFGSFMELFIGRRRLALFFILAGLVGSLSHALTSAFVVGLPKLPALGASGGVAGVILLFSLLFPKEKILLFAVIPMPALVGALAFVGLDLWGLYSQSQGGGLPIGHGAHLGGAFTGLLYYLYLRVWARRARLSRRA